MRALVGLAMCIAGCTFDHGRLGGSDDDGTGSGSDQQPDQDSDGDGFTDLVDNCATVGNADQYDHDDDGRGDSCDGCPHLMDTGNDTDADGVADACDPRPTDPGDRIAFFDGFYAPPAWDAVIGENAWVAQNGVLRQPNVDNVYQLVRDDEPNLGQSFVDIRMRVNDISMNTSTRRSSGIVLSYRDPSHFLFCGIAAAPQPQSAEVNAGEVYTDWLGFQQYDYSQGAFPAQMSGEWLTLQARTTRTANGTKLECVTHRASVTGTATYEGGAQIEGDVGVRTNGVDASFDYVFVVASPASSS